MQVKGVSSEAFRVSVSSAPSSSSQGSGQDDYDAPGDVYVWGEGILDGFMGDRADKVVSASGAKADALLPKPLESALVLDVHHIACGVRHAALVTRQGEIFTWGEECGGRLGHGVGSDVWQPQLVEALANTSVDFVACGEYHTCAVSMAGELYTWGDGSHNISLLGHGNDVSHWIPKNISGPLDGIQVSSIACGPWHTALVTSTGQLFTFGDGTFGVLGHGDRRSVSFPREVESLKDLRTVRVACGVWHTAAVVEVIVGHSSASSCSGKLFTWGDGDKGRLGHGDKERKLVPTCVPTLIDYNFQRLACGHSLTVGLSTSGQVFTMGSVVYGQLGNPQSDGKLPCLVEGKLDGETVEEISCGAYHVAVLTAKTEVYTWGKGANGRLGHGDVEDRKTPTLVEALKEKHVKNIACGSSFTAAVCLHKWVSGADQSVCSGCRQSFGFTRKRHNCYNCGQVHCHSCSSKKALKAALAPNPNKSYRVCDSCYVKLKKASEAGLASINNKRTMPPRRPNDSKDRSDNPEAKVSKTLRLPHLEGKTQTKRGKKSESSSSRASQVPPLLQLKDIKFSNSLDPQNTLSKAVLSFPQSRNTSRAASPFSRRPSPPRSATPTPTMGGLASSKSVVDDLKKTNEVMNKEVLKLRDQVENLKQRCGHQEAELHRTAKQAQEAISLAAEESAKCKAAKEVIKSLTAQLKDMAERLPVGVYDNDRLRPTYPHAASLNGVHHPMISDTVQIVDRESGLPNDTKYSLSVASSSATDNSDANGVIGPHPSHSSAVTGGQEFMEQPGTRLTDDDGRESKTAQNLENGSRARFTAVENGHEAETEWVEQDEPGVYITLMSLSDGTKDLKRVRFSRKRFTERQAEIWWSENRVRVFEQYNVRGIDRAVTGGSGQLTSGKEAEVTSSSPNVTQ
eukprot:Gb_13554 [translate_table: standard]